MKKLQNTVKELKDTKIKFVLTRFDSSNAEHGDLDILVKDKDFDKIIKKLKELGYKNSSHDQALGGRIKGAQKNITKKDRIKIDLHRDLTWRSDRYLDLDIIWWNLRKNNIDGNEALVPDKKIDAFLVLINVIFEKGYLTQDEYDLMWSEMEKIKKDKDLKEQAEKYGWNNTYDRFLKWTKEIGKIKKFPQFLPLPLIMFSYLEKLLKNRTFHMTSFFYYFFFRTRYFINKQLPYD